MSGSNTQEVTAQQARNQLLGQILITLKTLGIQLGAKSSTATGGAATLPSNPVGFVTVTFSDGTTGKLPYYAT
jgi:hypothetical protein